MSRDYYEVLGVPRDADKSQIKSAFKRMARQYHPDVAQDKADAEQKFGEINEAYSVLGDDEKRAYYDRYGHAPGQQQQQGAGFGGFGGGGGFGFGDIFEAIFDMGGGGRRQQRRGPMRGPDLRTGVSVTLEEAYSGAVRELELNSDVTCPKCDGRRSATPDGFKNCRECHGTGQLHQQINTPFGRLTQMAPCAACGGEGRQLTDPCKECSGRGQVTKKRKLEVKIPAGIDTGRMIRVEGEGAPGKMGGPPGDLYLAIDVQDHEAFERRGDDLIHKLKVRFTDAALGEKVKVPILGGGEEWLDIPAGTQNNTIFRIKGKGMPRLGRNSHGDLHVIIEVMIPTKLNSKQKKLLREFAEAGSQDAEPSLFTRIKDAIFG
jgi:molecular chaperone DnaJ